MGNESPWDWLLVGLVISGVGGALLLATDNRFAVVGGVVLVAIGGLVTLIYAIALGVQIGLARHAQVRQGLDRRE